MPTKLLYALALPDRNQDRASGQGRRNQATSGTLGSGTPSVESISLEPGEQLIAGGFGNEYAEVMAQEFEELFNAEDIPVVPYTVIDSSDPEDGYYTLRDVESQAEVPAERRIQRFDGAMTRKGSRRTYFRIVGYNQNTVSNPFGSATTAEVALPSAARSVRWFDLLGDSSTESATVQRTETGEHADVEFYDTNEPSFDTPRLVFDVPYQDEWPADCRLWDDYDRNKTVKTDSGDTTVSTDTHVGSATVGSSTVVPVTWQRVYRKTHHFRGQPVAETGRLRLRFDEDREILTAFQWDTGDDIYSPVQLGTGVDWHLRDVTFTRIGAERITADVLFTDDSSFHTLKLALDRGKDTAQFWNPSGAASVPAGLQTRLDPIASDSDTTVEAAQDVIERTEVDG